MPRPTKCRRICHLPEICQWQPQGEAEAKVPILLTVDEYEALRLIDGEGLSQEQCSARMEIARATAQKIYDSGRRKLARMLTEGRPLTISGGRYRLCDGQEAPCTCGSCHKKTYFMPKGENIMRIAVTYENGFIFQHFGHTAQFKVYDVENGAVAAAQVVSTNGSGHGALAEILHALKVDTLISGGIGGGAQMALASAGIRLYGGVSGSADEAVAALLAGELDYNPNVRCSHHDDHHGEGHTCGSHGCGSHSCGNH